MIILIAVLALVVVNALAESPWGVFSLLMTIPIALFMGVYLRYLRPGRVSEVSLIGVALLLLAIISGGWVAETEWGQGWFTLGKVTHRLGHASSTASPPRCCRCGCCWPRGTTCRPS